MGFDLCFIMNVWSWLLMLFVFWVVGGFIDGVVYSRGICLIEFGCLIDCIWAWMLWFACWIYDWLNLI